MGYSPWGRKGSDMTERLNNRHVDSTFLVSVFSYSEGRGGLGKESWSLGWGGERCLGQLSGGQVSVPGTLSRGPGLCILYPGRVSPPQDSPPDS